MKYIYDSLLVYILLHYTITCTITWVHGSVITMSYNRIEGVAPHDTDREKIGTMGTCIRTVNGPLIDQTLNSD